MRWTEKEAIKRGYVKDKNGNLRKGSSPPGWDLLRQASSSYSDSLSFGESGAIDEHEGQTGSEKRDEVVGKKSNRRFRVTVTSFTRFHTDPDNLFSKFFVDELVRAGFLPDDSSRFIESFEKKVIIVKEEREERTEIVVICLQEKQ